MDIELMRKQLDELGESITYDKAILATAVETNAKLLKAREGKDKCIELLNELRSYRSTIGVLYSVCNTKASSLTSERKAIIEKTVEENLMYLFPDEGFKVRINLDISRAGRESCQLLLGSKIETTGDMEYSATTAQNGRFVRQLISVVVVYALNYLRGSDTLFMDEALASSDKTNLTRLEPLLNRMRASGMQIILVEHKPELYDGVDHRHFTLRKDRESGVTKIVQVEEVRG